MNGLIFSSGRGGIHGSSIQKVIYTDLPASVISGVSKASLMQSSHLLLGLPPDLLLPVQPFLKFRVS